MGFKVAAIVCGVLLCYLGQTEGACSSNSQISCRSNNQCINLSDVCGNGQQCTDGSDEDPKICSFWVISRSCSRGQLHCTSSTSYGGLLGGSHRSSGCRTIWDYCSSSTCSKNVDSRMCELVTSRKLSIEPEESGMALTEELVNMMQEAVNTTSKTTSCPMFYLRVGESCLSFFSPAKVPWAEARQFCLSIGGDLLSVGKTDVQEKLLQYMMMSRLTSDYWIGGRYDVDTNAWSWVQDDSSMPLGSPYWATRYSSSCVPRSPPHTDPFSDPSAALPGAPCYNYLQAPVMRSSGWCAAINYEHYYYFTDEACQDHRSPLCIYTSKE